MNSPDQLDEILDPMFALPMFPPKRMTKEEMLDLQKDVRKSQILALYVSKTDIKAAIGEDEDQDPLNNGIQVELEAFAHNQLRAELRQKLLGGDDSALNKLGDKE